MAPLPYKVHQPWATMGYTFLFSLGIGLMSWSFEGSGTIWTHLMVSICIGLSINGAFILLGPWANARMNPYIAPIPIVAAGLTAGLLLAGWAVIGAPLFFFGDDFSTLIAGIFFGIVGTALFVTRARLHNTASQLSQAQLASERQQKLVAETELKLLQAQIEPHFLFNTLSNIAGLIRSNPDQAEQTLLNLTTLLRASLNRTRQGATTLSQELEIAEAYLEIQTIRMQGRLRYTVQQCEQTSSLPLPPMLVQPLVENAVKHGIDPDERGGEISVASRIEDDSLIVTVSDSGVGVSDQPRSRGSGTGLRNVRERLQAIYGDRASLSLFDNTPRGTVARLSIPLNAPHAVQLTAARPQTETGVTL